MKSSVNLLKTRRMIIVIILGYLNFCIAMVLRWILWQCLWIGPLPCLHWVCLV